MSYQNSSSDCTSSNLEKEALKRFRSLVDFLPKTCYIFREPWDCSTVVCLDFANCPDAVGRVKLQSPELLEAATSLGLGNALIFRIGSKFMGYIGNTPSP